MGGRHQVLGFLLFCQAASIEDKRQSQISEKRPHGDGGAWPASVIFAGQHRRSVTVDQPAVALFDPIPVSLSIE